VVARQQTTTILSQGFNGNDRMDGHWDDDGDELRLFYLLNILPRLETIEWLGIEMMMTNIARGIQNVSSVERISEVLL
jgi:hypothetical protein